MKWTFPVCQPARLASRASLKPVVILAVLVVVLVVVVVVVVVVVLEVVVVILVVTKVPSIMPQKNICPLPTNVRHAGTYLPNYTSITSHTTATFMMTAVKVK
jgi:hypothetical protein